MRIEIEFPYYAEFRVPGKRLPQREYLLGKAEFVLRELNPSTTRPICTMDVAWETGKDAHRREVEDRFNKAMFGIRPKPHPQGEVTLVSDGSGVYWPATSFRSGTALKLDEWLNEIQKHDARETARNAARHAGDMARRFSLRNDFHDVLRLDDILDRSRSGLRKGILCAKPRPRTAEEVGIGKLLVDTSAMCRDAIASKLENVAVHEGVIFRDRGEPMYHVGSSLMDGVTMKVVAFKETNRPEANLGAFPEEQLFRIDRHGDAAEYAGRKNGVAPKIEAVKLTEWRPEIDPLAIMVEKTSMTLDFVFEKLRQRRSRWNYVPADLRDAIDEMFPSKEGLRHRAIDVFKLMDLLEDCDQRLHSVYWERPDADARRPARELMEYSKALKKRVERDIAYGVIEPPETISLHP